MQTDNKYYYIRNLYQLTASNADVCPAHIRTPQGFHEAYACGTSLTQICRMAQQSGSLHTEKLTEAMKLLYAMMAKVNYAYISLDNLDVPAVLERGRLLAESEAAGNP